MHERAKKTFPDDRISVIQMVSGALQTGRSQAGFLVTIHACAPRLIYMPSSQSLFSQDVSLAQLRCPCAWQETAVDLPFSVEMLKHRASRSEATRLRCLCRFCPKRSDQERQQLVKDVPDVRAEIGADDKETLPFDVEAPAEFGDSAAGDDEPMPLPGAGEVDGERRDYLVDLLPHAKPMRSRAAFLRQHGYVFMPSEYSLMVQGFFNQLLIDVLQVAGTVQLLVVTSTAHPGAFFAARHNRQELFVVRNLQRPELVEVPNMFPLCECLRGVVHVGRPPQRA